MRIKFILLLLLLLCSCSFYNNKNSDILYLNNSNYWTNDLNEIELVMSYVMTSKDYQTMKKRDANKRLEFLNSYWLTLDPDSTTIDNELLLELNRRVLKSKELFSGFDGGLMSDRARIYITYGPPTNEYKSYIDNQELITWSYKTGYEFNFISDNFGRYRIINYEFIR